MVKILTNIKDLCHQIASLTVNKPELIIQGEFLKVQYKTIEDYRIGTNKMTENNIGYHILNPPNRQVIKVVIKGIHINTNIDEIKEELTNMGFDVTKVAQLRRLRDGVPLPIFQVQVKITPNVDEIYKITNFQFLTVKVEKYVPLARISQCYKCQSFYHSSQNCHNNPKCVKCGKDHETRYCTKTPDEKPTCVNCNGEHPANYRGCPMFPKLRQINRSHPQQRRSQQSSNDQQNLPRINSRRTAWGSQNQQDNQPADSNYNHDFPSLPRNSPNRSPDQPNPPPQCWELMLKIIEDLRSEIKQLKEKLDSVTKQNGQNV